MFDNTEALLAFNKLSEYIERLDNYTSVVEFFDDENVLNYIEQLRKFRSSKELYLDIIGILINKSRLDNFTKRNLVKLFGNSTDLTISNYRIYSRFNASLKYNLEKTQRDNINHNLSIEFMNDLKEYGLEHIEIKYKEILGKIAEFNSIDHGRLIVILKEYLQAIDPRRKAKLDVEIKEFIRKYIVKDKAVNIENYIEQNMESIKINFDKKNEATISATQRELLIPNYINIYGVNLSNYIQEVFGVNIEGDSLRNFVINFSKDDSINLSFLGLVEPGTLCDCKPRKTFNRLNKNFLNEINRILDVEQLSIIKLFLSGDHSVDKKLTKEQQGLLNFIIPLLREARAEIIVNEETKKFEIITEIADISQLEEVRILEYTRMVQKYKALKVQFFDYVNNNAQKSINEETKETFFRDDYYELNTEYTYLNNYIFIGKLIDNMFKRDIQLFELNDSILAFLSDIIPCYLVSGTDDDISFLCDFIDNIEKYPKNCIFKISELSNIHKLVTLYKYVDENILNILGEDVCKKLVFKDQFIDKPKDDATIRKRLEKAVFAMSKAYDLTHSSIPYFDDVVVGDITLQRYNNADPQILTSGIDTNTCFKLDGNDNDFVLYSILSSNGLVIRILEKGELCGRITANLYFNVLIINGIRNKSNTYKISSEDERKKNQNIINAVEILAQKLIDLTTNNNCPIDFVCTNMAGILESHQFWEEKEQVPVHVITNPIDTYNEDFNNFVSLFADHPEYLSQINVKREDSYFNNAPFTTDFGSYPFVLIRSRNNKYLQRRSDVAYTPQEPIYQRPNLFSKMGSGYLTDEHIKQCERIKSLYVYNTSGGLHDDTKLYYDLSKNFKAYFINDTKAIFETMGGIEFSLKIR